LKVGVLGDASGSGMSLLTYQSSGKGSFSFKLKSFRDVAIEKGTCTSQPRVGASRTIFHEQTGTKQSIGP
jgi:hypothetical protein